MTKHKLSREGRGKLSQVLLNKSINTLIICKTDYNGDVRNETTYPMMGHVVTNRKKVVIK
jgi:hypothetical protein